MLVNRLPQIMNQRHVSIRQLSRATGITYTTIRETSTVMYRTAANLSPS